VKHTFLFVVVGATGCSTYQVHRAATTPHAEPVLYSAEPSEGIAEIGLGASSLAHMLKLKEGNPDAAVEVPGTQVRGDVRFQLTDALALGVAYENGIEQTVQQGKSTQPPVEHGNPQGYTFLTDVSIKTNNPNLLVGLHFDMGIWRIPYVEWLTCVENCGIEPYTVQTKGIDQIVTFGAGVTPTYKAGPVTWFGGLTARQHPTIEEKGTEEGLDLEADVQSGPFNFVLSAGIEAKLGGVVKGSLVLYQNLSSDPVQYGPGIGAMIYVPLGKRHRAPAPSAPPPPAWGPPPPPPPAAGPSPVP
jgi:hypothetical protein